MNYKLGVQEFHLWIWAPASLQKDSIQIPFRFRGERNPDSEITGDSRGGKKEARGRLGSCGVTGPSLEGQGGKFT